MWTLTWQWGGSPGGAGAGSMQSLCRTPPVFSQLPWRCHFSHHDTLHRRFHMWKASNQAALSCLFRWVGWGRPMFITVVFCFFFYTKKHQRKLWKRTSPLRKGLAERAVALELPGAQTLGVSLHSKSTNTDFFFPKANSVRKGQKLL